MLLKLRVLLYCKTQMFQTNISRQIKAGYKSLEGILLLFALGAKTQGPFHT